MIFLNILKKSKGIIFLILIISCSKKVKNTNEDTSYQKWENLEVETRCQTIKISKFSDSAEYENIVYKKGVYDIPPKYVIDKKQKYKVYFSKSEKDSLARYIYESVTNPKFTNILATDYVGNVKLKFDRENMNLICEYKSVGRWNEVSQNTKKIYELIKSKVEISEQ
jgi:hypothetical protein